MALTLKVLGCATPYPRPGEPCSGYLAQTSNARLWIDCGPGTFVALQQHIDPTDLTALWISHLHPDHSGDLFAVYNWLINSPDAPRMPVYGPKGWANRLAGMIPDANPIDLVRQAFDVHELHDNHHVDVADLHLQTLAVHHSVPAYGLRLNHEGQTLAYSGDTGPCEALIAVAQDADLFVCEAGAEQSHPTHCTAGDAGTAALHADARRLLLVHVTDPARRQAAADIAAGESNCPVAPAAPGLAVSLTSGA